MYKYRLNRDKKELTDSWISRFECAGIFSGKLKEELKKCIAEMDDLIFKRPLNYRVRINPALDGVTLSDGGYLNKIKDVKIKNSDKHDVVYNAGYLLTGKEVKEIEKRIRGAVDKFFKTADDNTANKIINFSLGRDAFRLGIVHHVRKPKIEIIEGLNRNPYTYIPSGISEIITSDDVDEDIQF